MNRLLLLAPLLFAGACTVDEDLGHRTDASPVFGAPRWALTLGSPGYDAANAVAIDSHGDVLVAGFVGGTSDFGSGPVAVPDGAYITKRAHDDGAELWTRTPAGVAGIGALAVAPDDSFVALGNASVLGFDATGALAWSTVPADGVFVNQQAIAPGPGGTWYVCGATSIDGENRAFLTLLGPDGAVRWTRRWTQAGIAALSPAANGDVLAIVTDTNSAWQLARITPSNAIAWSRDLDSGQVQAVAELADGSIAYVSEQLNSTEPELTITLQLADANGAPTLTSAPEEAQLGRVALDRAGRLLLAANGAPTFAGHDVKYTSFLGAWDPSTATPIDARHLDLPNLTGPNASSAAMSVAAAPTGGAVAATLSVGAPVDFGTGMRPYIGGMRDGMVVLYDPPAP